MLRRLTLRERMAHKLARIARMLAYVAGRRPYADERDGNVLTRLLALVFMLAYDVPYAVYMRAPAGSRLEALAIRVCDAIADVSLYRLPYVSPSL